jgi:hypothetical protein
VVNAVVIGAFASMAFLANIMIIVRPISPWISYLGLFVSLGLSMVFPYGLLSELPSPKKALAVAVVVALPVFFSGLVFSSSFRNLERPAEALGINMLGAVVGGVLENSVMIGGTQILEVLALALYGLSAAFRRKAGASE